MISGTNKLAKKYFDMAETTFKESFRSHKKDIRRKKYINNTGLSKYMPKLKDEKLIPNIRWNMMSIVHGKPKRYVCKPCLAEKSFILKYLNDKYLLNIKSEFISKLIYENKLPRGSLIVAVLLYYLSFHS